MSRFYFHVLDNLDTPDDEGAELQDLGAARIYAIHAARVLMSETLKHEGRITLHHHIDVEDEAGTILAKVSYSEAVEVEH